MTRVLIFGDSITAGAWDKGGGWTQRLIKFLFGKVIDGNDFYGFAYNLGVSGDTTEDLLERFEFETKARLKDTEETVFLFSIGANDSALVHSKKSMNIPENKFRKNIQNLIRLAQKYSSKIVFVGLFPVDEPKVDPIPWAPDKSYKYQNSKEYNDIIKNVCIKNKIYFIDMFNKITKMNYKKLLEDGVHPNTEGHKLIFESVKDFLIKNKII